MDVQNRFTVTQTFQSTVQRFPDKVALRYTVAKPDAPAHAQKFSEQFQQIEYTWKQYDQETTRFAKSLIAHGVQPYKGVTIQGANTPEWFIAHIGAIKAGGFSAGVYPSNNPAATQHCVTNSRAEVVVVENEEQLKKYKGLKDSAVKCFVVWNEVKDKGGFSELGEVYEWKDFLEHGKTIKDEELEQRIKAQNPEDLCSLIYTSGTTGQPKGAKLTHDNITFTSREAGERLDLNAKHHSISYLPASHIAAQQVDIFTAITFGYTMDIAPPGALKGSAMKLHILNTRPTFFLAVPDVWNKMKDGMIEKMNQATGTAAEVKKFLFNRVTPIARYCLQDLQKLEAREYSKAHAMWHIADRIRGIFDRFALAVCNFLLLSKIKGLIGLDRCVLAASGAAPISRDTVDFLAGLNIRIIDLYGMSETSGLITIPDASTPSGSVGKPLPGTDVKLSDPNEDGLREILVKGRNIMRGYQDNTKSTNEAFTDDYFFKTGDAGKFDEKGNLYILGRIDDQYKTSAGEKVQPVPIEDHLRNELSFLSQAVVIAEKKKFVTCLISLKTDETNPDNLAKPIGNSTTVAQAIEDPEVQRLIEDGMARANKHAPNTANHVKKFTIVAEDFTEANGLMTPTRKLKRKVIAERFAGSIDKMYNS